MYFVEVTHVKISPLIILLHVSEEQKNALKDCEYAMTIECFDPIRNCFMELDSFRLKFSEKDQWEIREPVVSIEWRLVWHIATSSIRSLPPAMTLGQLIRIDSILYSFPDQLDFRLLINHVIHTKNLISLLLLLTSITRIWSKFQMK